MSDPVSRLNAALEGRYRIERELGEGGMATVYLADDIKHERKVALKVLKSELAAIVGAERFLAEIKTTANLQHPHILPLFDSGEADGFLFYVMPYIEGETLRDRIDREKQLPIEDAIEIAKAVAGALDYAHRHGVIHRDIKPENVLTHDDQVLVADFGIAIAVSQAGGSRLTETGLSLGTPHYMSPEQATGDRDIDGRSDVYALGCMTYEMLVGEPPHTGPTTQAIIAKLITEEPDLPSKRRSTVPPNVDGALQKALAKLPADRFATAADFSRALGDVSFTSATASQGGTQVSSEKRWRLLAVAASAVAILASIAAITLAVTTAETPATHRVSVALPEGQGLRNPWLGTSIAVSANGEVFAYLGDHDGPTWQIWVRKRGDLEAEPVRGTASATDPAVSPDGTEIAFTTGSPGPIKIVTLAGGAIRTVVDSAGWRGLDWPGDGYLYFTTVDGLARVRLDGSDIEVLSTPEAGVTHIYPDVLPGSRAAVFTISDALQASGEIGVVEFSTGKITTLATGTHAHYLATGHLSWTTVSGDLMAAPFDLDRLELTGQAQPIVEQVSVGPYGGAHLAVSATGTLLYRRGDIMSRVAPVWVARDGTVEEIKPGWAAPVIAGSMGIALSPDGSQFVFPIMGPRSTDLWLHDLSGNGTRLTFAGRNARPQWTPDGESVGFLSTRERIGREAWVKRADGSGTAERLLTDDRQIDELAFSHDGKWLVYRLGSGASRDLYAMRLGVDTVGTALLVTEYEERSASLSPDDRWMAYISNESGRDEVFVRPFPVASASKWQVSTDGGTEPVWSRDGRELFYRNGDDDLIAVEIKAATLFSVGQKRVLFSALPYQADPNHPNYDVHPDGQRFLMLRNVSSGGGELIWVEHWFEELRELLGG